MGNELVVREMDFDTLQRQALALQASGYFKDGRDPLNKAQAITKVLAGAELGLPPFASMSGLHIIQGKPVLGSNLIATLVKNSGRYDYRVKQCDNEACTIEWFEDGESVGEAGFTMDEAKAAKLTGKDNWQKYPSDMLFARAISRGARRFAPGVFGGAPVYSPDEFDADEDNNIVSVTGPEIDEETGEITDPNGSDELPTAEFEEIQSATEEDAPANGSDPSGARTADEVKAALIAASMEGSEAPASDKQLKYARASMSKLVEGDADKAKALLYHVYGLDSSSELSKAQASALIDWIDANESNDYTPSETAQLEAARMLRAFEIERGQGELALNEEPS